MGRDSTYAAEIRRHYATRQRMQVLRDRSATDSGRASAQREVDFHDGRARQLREAADREAAD